MKIHTIQITASPDADPETKANYRWTFGDPLPDLELARDLLDAYIIQIKNPAGKALSAKHAIPTE